MEKLLKIFDGDYEVEAALTWRTSRKVVLRFREARWQEVRDDEGQYWDRRVDRDDTIRI